MADSIANMPVSEASSGGVVEILARPNRSATSASLIWVFCILSVAVLAVALFSFVLGNVLAPLFAVLDLTLVGGCLYWVWRRGDDYDRIRLGKDEVAIESKRGQTAHSVVYQTGWARVWSEHDLRRRIACVFVGSHGQRTEVGSFLIDAQRAELEALIKKRLGQARAFPGLDSQVTR